MINRGKSILKCCFCSSGSSNRPLGGSSISGSPSASPSLFSSRSLLHLQERLNRIGRRLGEFYNQGVALHPRFSKRRGQPIEDRTEPANVRTVKGQLYRRHWLSPATAAYIAADSHGPPEHYMGLKIIRDPSNIDIVAKPDRRLERLAQVMLRY